jgi:nitronate monooxygenase
MPIPPQFAGRLRLPVIGSPMYITSSPTLVIAQCRAGVIGTFPAAGARSLSQLEEWLIEIEEALAKWDREHPEQPSAPYGVNQIIYKTNDRLEDDLALCTARRTPLIISSLGAREDLNRVVKGYGGVTLHDVIDDRFARKAIEKGASGLIAVATGAGGHAGRYSPFALVREIREWFDGPLALAGAIATGEGILAAQAIGADFAYIGSAFMPTLEAAGPDEQKRCIVEARAEDIVYTNYFTGVHGNYLRPSIVAAGLDPDDLPKELQVMDFRSGGKSQAKIWRDIWACGQGIGPIKEVVPCAEVVDRLEREYRAAFARLGALQSENAASAMA